MKATHKAGLPSAGPMAAEDCLAANIKQNKVFFESKDPTNVLIHPILQLGKVIEESEQEWPKEGRRQYHAISR